MALLLDALLLEAAPHYISPEEACARLGVDEYTLLKMIRAGKVDVALFEGRLMVAESSVDGLLDSAPLLRKWPENGTIVSDMERHGTKVSDLPLAVAGDDINARLAAIKREDFAHLEGKPITVSEAAEKYKVTPQTIHNWVKSGYIRLLRKGTSKSNPSLCNEADVAYCAEISNTRKLLGIRFGTPLLDSEGRPYLLKHPALSLYRRQHKE